MDKNKGYFLPKPEFKVLFAALKNQGFQTLSMVERNSALGFHPVDSADQLVQGVTDHQAPGSYRLEQTDSNRYFDWSNGPTSLKPILFQPKETLWLAEVDSAGGLQIQEPLVDIKLTAVIGARPCDLAALSMLDQHFLEEAYPDPSYQSRRDNLFIVAVNCSSPSDNCFCVSTGDGPHAHQGYDLLLTELDDGFIVKSGSESGVHFVAQIESHLEPLQEAHKELAIEQLNQAVNAQNKRLPEGNLQSLFIANWDSDVWSEVAEQCLACGNCTSVCPTCFCHREEDLAVGLNGQVEHQRLWDSCFGDEHGYMAGHQVRPDIASRYRQWMTHKLGHWHEQFGRSGCVGCGRCTTWCPAQIDFVEVAKAAVGGEK